MTLRYLANISTKKLSFFVRITIFILFLVLAVLFALGGRFILSLPLALISIGLIKLKGLTVFQIFQLWRLVNFLRTSGRFSKTNFGQAENSSDLSLDEAYKILNLKGNATKEDVNKSAKNLQKKLHPDVSPETSRLSALVNEAKEKILKNIS